MSRVFAALSSWYLPTLLAVVGLVALLILWNLPRWQVSRVRGLNSKERFDRVNEARKTLATILGGIVLLAGFFGTWQNLKVSQETLRVSQEGQITDRFTKAIEQLGAVNPDGVKKMVVRLGGIYALERIANESERDHWPIMEVLCTYVRNVAPIKRQQSTREKQAPSERPNSPIDEHPEADVQAILTVIGRRERKYEKITEILDLSSADLYGADLYGAHLGRANLREADLHGANLSGANLSEADLTNAILAEAGLVEADLSGAHLGWADLSGANLANANLSEARLGGAHLSRANLAGANLTLANLRAAHLREADLGGAHLSRTDLRGADLTDVLYLRQEQVDEADGDSRTKLPANLHMPERWEKD